MEIRMIRCPKCAHEQKGRVECEACGLIFARYARARDRQKEKETAVGNGQPSSGMGVKILGIAVLMLVTAGLTYYFVRPTDQTKVQAPAANQAATPAPEQPPVVAKQPTATSPAAKAPAAEQGRSIEEARNATVSIETPWGTGSGFFVNKNSIITNRHVVEMDPAKLAELRTQVETGRKLIEL